MSQIVDQAEVGQTMSVREVARQFCSGVYDRRIDGYIWPNVFKFLLQNADRLQYDKNKIHALWIENGGNLRRKINLFWKSYRNSYPHMTRVI